MAALAGLQIDNCLVELDAPEPPGMDGSSFALCRGHPLGRRRGTVGPTATLRQRSDLDRRRAGPRSKRNHLSSRVAAGRWRSRYHLDYGPALADPRARADGRDHARELLERIGLFPHVCAGARSGATAGRPDTEPAPAPRICWSSGPNGPIDNELRADDEFARHKILDCLGDFALLGLRHPRPFLRLSIGSPLESRAGSQIAGASASDEIRRRLSSRSMN